MVGLILTPFMFNEDLVGAYEVVWWVEPEAQGLGVGRALLEAVEPACRKKNDKLALIQMVHLKESPPQAAVLYEHLGYQHSESSYTKVI
jgi:GNAT superfamily N-acetyltransferase